MTASTSAATIERLAIGGCEHAYDELGKGPPLIMIHGLGTSRLIWSDVRAHLGHKFRTIAYDIRGAGLTRHPTDVEFSLETWARDLEGIVDGLRIDMPVLVGHSLGAAIALRFSLTAPDRVAGLVLAGADARLSQLGTRMRRSAELIGNVGLDHWVGDYWSRNVPFSGTSLARRPDILVRYRDLLLANDPHDYVKTCNAIAEAEDLTGHLGAVNAPTLVVVGGADDRTLPEDGRAIASKIPNSVLAELHDVGHTIPLEAPGELAAAIRGFLSDAGIGTQ